MSCPTCGLDTSATLPGDVVAALRSFARRYQAPLTRFLPGEDAEALVTWRPGADQPSALELAADVDATLAEVDDEVSRRAGGAPTGAGPEGEGRLAVAERLSARALALAERFEALEPKAWNAAEGGESVLDLGRRAVHAGHHGLLVVGQALRAARQAGAGRA